MQAELEHGAIGWEAQLRTTERARRRAEASLSTATRMRVDLVRDARARGASWGAIAAVLGCSRTRVVQIAGSPVDVQET